MSEGTSEVTEAVEPEASAASKRKTLSLSDRIKVIDYLRAKVEPIVADSNAALAGMVSTETGVEINWAQLKYMIDELPDMNLGSKVYVKSMLSVEDQLQACYERDISFEAKIAQLEEQVKQTAAALLELTKKVMQ